MLKEGKIIEKTTEDVFGLLYLVDFHGLDFARVSDMWTSAQVNQGPTSNEGDEENKNRIKTASKLTAMYKAV